MTHRAVLVGINYTNTTHALNGCINDVRAINAVLVNELNFDKTNITILLENDATTFNILDSLEQMVADSVPGDVLFFHYSGHGSQVYNRDGNELDGLDEILCPIDLNWDDKIIRDDDLKTIFDKVPNGVRFTVILDCCNSGTAMDHDEHYQPSVRVLVQEPECTNEYGNRFLPPPISMIEQAKMYKRINSPRSIAKRDLNKTGMLISGCRSDQTSADAFINGKYMGACTHHFLNILHEHKYCISYVNMINALNERLAKHGFSQRPELDGPANMHNLPVIVCMSTSKDAIEYHSPKISAVSQLLLYIGRIFKRFF